MSDRPSYETFPGSHVPIKAWTRGVPFEAGAKKQVEGVAAMPFVHKWVAIMPDVHQGIGATVGSVIATTTAIIPAAVGVDIGCGMMAVETSLESPAAYKPIDDVMKAQADLVEIVHTLKQVMCVKG